MHLYDIQSILELPYILFHIKQYPGIQYLITQLYIFPVQVQFLLFLKESQNRSFGSLLIAREFERFAFPESFFIIFGAGN